MVERTKKSAHLAAGRKDVLTRIAGTPIKQEIYKDANYMRANTTVFEEESVRVVRAATVMAEDAFEAFDKAYKKMLQREVDVEARVKTHVSTLKDKANQIAEAIGRINKLAGPDIEEKLSRLERFANAVETLDRLNKSGKLSEVANAISGLNK